MEKEAYIVSALYINIAAGTLWKHVEHTRSIGWVVPNLVVDEHEKNCNIFLEKIFPYYMKRSMVSVESYDFVLSSVSVLTGPNMCGKSTFLRSVGVAVLLANVGLLVPATKAIIPFLDTIAFVGYVSDAPLDDISGFARECQNLKQVLDMMRGRGFVCFDEFGRSTQAQEGAAMLMSIMVELVSYNHMGIFATHYCSYLYKLLQQHSLKALQNDIQIFKITLDEKQAGTRQLLEGISFDSQAFKVVRQFNMSKDVIEMAQEIYLDLKKLEGEQCSIGQQVDK